MPSVSINVITRNNPEGLRRALASAYEAIWEEGDEAIVVDTGSADEALEQTRAVCAAFTQCQLLERPDLLVASADEAREWLSDEAFALLGDGRVLKSFAAAREVARAASKNPVIVWLDTDDELIEEQPGVFRKLIEDTMNPEAPKVSAIYLDYRYAFAPDGTCTTTLRRERAVFKDWFEWRGHCHETLCPLEGTPGAQMPQGFFEGLPAFVEHDKVNDESEELRASDARNYVILRRELENDIKAGRQQDPRSLFYFGNATRGLGRYFEAIEIYKDFITKSGSQDDRFAASYYIGSMYMQPELSRPWDAIHWFHRAAEINPFDPRACYGLARAYAFMSRWRESMLWYEHGEKLPEPNGLHSYDPTHVLFHPHVVAAHCCRKLDKYDKAKEYLAKAAAYRPNNQEIQESLRLMHNEANGHALAEAIQRVLANLKYKGPPALTFGKEIASKLVAVPPALEKAGLGRTEPPEDRGPGPHVAIWCGGTHEKWSWRAEETGIGGSEKMVILLADALQARGVNVSVYAEVPHADRGTSPAGVVWRHFSEFDQTRPRDVLVLWRNPGAVECLPSPAKKRVLWNHDVQNPAAYTERLRAVVDLVQFQSEFHAKPVAGALREPQRWIARNAIDPARFASSDVARDPKTVVYLSSPDRGLLTAAKIVERAQKIDPEIKLVCLYGFTPWARNAYALNQHMYIPDLGHDWSVDAYERKLFAQLDKIGATVLGRVGWKQVSALLYSAGAWLYPTRFPEISCMAAMEAQAHGVIPVCTTYGALAETVLEKEFCLAAVEDTDLWLDRQAQTLIDACKVSADDPRRVTMAESAIAAFNIDDLAEDWINRLGLREAFVAAGQEGNDERAVPESDVIKQALKEIGGFGRGEQYAACADRPRPGTDEPS